jgi:hypothetical protein
MYFPRHAGSVFLTRITLQCKSTYGLSGGNSNSYNTYGGNYGGDVTLTSSSEYAQQTGSSYDSSSSNGYSGGSSNSYSGGDSSNSYSGGDSSNSYSGGSSNGYSS